MTSLIQDAAKICNRAWTWWTDELRGLVTWHGSAAAQPVSDITIGVRDGLIVSVDVPYEFATGGALENGEADFEIRLLQDLEQRAAHLPTRVKLHIDPKSCLARKLEIPRAVRQDIHRIAELDLERATPFRAGEVYTCVVPEPQIGSGPLLAYTQYVVKKSTLAPVVERLARCGAVVTSAECVDQVTGRVVPIEFLARSSGPEMAGERRPVIGSGLLAATAAALGMASLIVSVYRHEQALTGLQADIRAVRYRLEKLAADEPRLNLESKAAKTLVKMKSARIPSVAILEELSRMIPQSAWISEFRLSGNSVDIAGYGRPAAALPPLLEESPLFAQASLTAPIATDAEVGKERIGLRLTLNNPAGRVDQPSLTAEPPDVLQDSSADPASVRVPEAQP